MKKLRVLLGLLASFVVIFGIIIATSNISLTQDETAVTKVEDKFPDGCVSCHVNQGEGKDLRIITLLSKHKKHPKVKFVKVVPTDCAKCHKEGRKFGSLRKVIHRAHFRNPATNPFLNDYNGNCSMCHKMDTETWKPVLKAGKANW